MHAWAHHPTGGLPIVGVSVLTHEPASAERRAGRHGGGPAPAPTAPLEVFPPPSRPWQTWGEPGVGLPSPAPLVRFIPRGRGGQTWVAPGSGRVPRAVPTTPGGCRRGPR